MKSKGGIGRGEELEGRGGSGREGRRWKGEEEVESRGGIGQRNLKKGKGGTPEIIKQH